jgi:hypothetical protein
MAASNATSAPPRPSRIGEILLAGRPMVALVAVLLTTGGHTMNLREMGMSQGWVPAEVYALQSCYLVSLALMMLACSSLRRRWSYLRLAEAGLVMAMVGSILNVMEVEQPQAVFLIGRIVAGAGAGMVIYSAPRLLDHRWVVPVAWATILCPVAGTGVISLATMMYESSDWRDAFLFEGGTAAIGLIALLPMTSTPETPPEAPRGSPAYLPSLMVASAALIYGLHWGQLHGWVEGPDIVAAFVIGAVAMCATLWLVWAQLDWLILRENWARLALFFFGGMCQFFHGYIMNIYGGTIVNLSSWQRAWLIWPLPIGMATSLIAASVALPRLRWRGGRIVLGLPVSIAGLLLLSAGLFLSYQQMMEWPYWDIRAVADLNWFPAPGEWEMAPGRFLMGLGIGLFMVAMDTQFSPDPGREETVRPLLNVVQLFGGGIAAALLINFLIIGHKVHYSYSADRDTIQTEELLDRETILSHELHMAGQAAPGHSAEVLLFRFVNYEADNLVFATIYAMWFLATMLLAGLFSILWVWRGQVKWRLRKI